MGARENNWAHTVLSTAALRPIDLIYGTCSIRPTAYERLWTAIDRGQVRLTVRPGGGPAEARVTYDHSVEILIPPVSLVSSVDAEALFVHEATHACFLTDPTVAPSHCWPQSDFEGIAYVAQVIYVLAAAGPGAELTMPIFFNPIVPCARRIFEGYGSPSIYAPMVERARMARATDSERETITTQIENATLGTLRPYARVRTRLVYADGRPDYADMMDDFESTSARDHH